VEAQGLLRRRRPDAVSISLSKPPTSRKIGEKWGTLCFSFERNWL